MPPTRAESAELPEAIAEAGACSPRACGHNHVVQVTHKHKHKAKFHVDVSGGSPHIAIGPNAKVHHSDTAASDEVQCPGERAIEISSASNNSSNGVKCDEHKRNERSTEEIEESVDNLRSPSELIGSVFPEHVFQGPGLEKGFYDDLKCACSFNESALSGNWVSTPMRGIREISGLRIDLNEQRTTDHFQEHREKNYNEEQVISLLPSLEKASRISGSSQDHQIVQLARFSEMNSAPTAVKHSLKLLGHLLLKEYSRPTVNAHIRTVEIILRQIIASENGIFMTETTHAQRLRVSVYSHVLCIIAAGQANGNLPQCLSENDRQHLKLELRPKLASLLNDLPYRRRDRMRYSMELILAGIRRLCSSKSPHLCSQLQEVLHSLKDMLSLESEKGVKELVKTLYEDSGKEWFDMHIVMHWLSGQVIKGNYRLKALQLIGLIIGECQTRLAKRRLGKNKDDWKIVLIAVNVLTNILRDSTEREIRREAARSTSKLIGCKNIQGSHDLRNIVEKYSRKAILYPHVEGRQMIIDSLLKTDGEVPSHICYKHLCAFYKINNLEIMEELFNSKHVIGYRAKFQSCPGALKILKITSSNSLCVERSPSSKHKKDFVNEAYYLRRLNQEHHPNVLRLLAFDTIGPLCHVITEYMHKGTARQFLMNCRQQKQVPPMEVYIGMCQNVVKALIFVSGLNIVHRDVRADNVFVAEDNSCKLGGFKSAIQTEAVKEGVSGEICDYIRVQGDHRQRWAAPECLLEGTYSGKSDVWAFGVYMYEVFTCGGTPYTTVMGLLEDEIQPHVLSGGCLSSHSCIPSEIYELMKKCWQPAKETRPTFEEIHHKLNTIADQLRNSDSKPLPNPPPLEPLQKRSGDRSRKELAKRSNALKRIRLECTTQQHLQNLRSLNNPHVTKVLLVESLSSSVTMVTESFLLATLLDYVKTCDCDVNDLILFAAQISSAMKYLHSKDIVHCFLSAENILVLNSKQVQVSGLRHCRTLSLSYYDNDSSTCVTRRPPPTGALRWCSPEAIQENIFSHASDVWSYGVMLWEVFINLWTKEKDRVITTPYSHLEDKEVLAALKRNIRLYQPDNCPDWLFIVMTQCWLYHACERPSFFLILDVLTQRNPWESYLLQLWMKKHDIFENWPNTQVTLPKCVTDVEEEHSTENELGLAVTEEFCSEHNYSYEKPFWIKFVRKVKKPFRKTKSRTLYTEPCVEEEYGEAHSNYANPESLLSLDKPPPLPPRDQEVAEVSRSSPTTEDDSNPKAFEAPEFTRMRRRDPPVPQDAEIVSEDTLRISPPLPPRPPLCCSPPHTSNPVLNWKYKSRSLNEVTKVQSVTPSSQSVEKSPTHQRNDSFSYEQPPCFPGNPSNSRPQTVSATYSNSPTWMEDPDRYCDTLGSVSTYTSLYDLPSSSDDIGRSRSSSSVTWDEFSGDTMSDVDSISFYMLEINNAAYDDTAFNVCGRTKNDHIQSIYNANDQEIVGVSGKEVAEAEDTEGNCQSKSRKTKIYLGDDSSTENGNTDSETDDSVETKS